MDFSTATATPIAVRINGTQYNLPRFLFPEMKQWAAEERKAQSEAATAHLNPDDKARFLTYFRPPPFDVFELAKWARSTDGADVVVDRQMKAAGVPEDVRQAFIKNVDPLLIADLADKLASAATAADGAQQMTQQGDDPLAKPPGESQDSVGAGATSSQNSTTATAA